MYVCMYVCMYPNNFKDLGIGGIGAEWMHG